MSDILIFGCTGYTGRLVVDFARSTNTKFIIAGRNESKVKLMAAELGLPYRVLDVEETQQVDASLKGIAVLLNCAGPFRHTARPLMEGCIRNSTHYLDVAAELDSYQHAEQLDIKAKTAEVMLMPGCGGSVAMLGCLTGHALEGFEKPSASVEVALHVAGAMSRGSAISAAQGVTNKCLMRRDGALVEQAATATQPFDFQDGHGSVDCFPVSLPDLTTIWKSTHAPNIQTFVHAAGDSFPAGDLSDLPDGPSAQQRESSPYHAAVVVRVEEGGMKRAALHTVNGYTFTAQASFQAVRRVLSGQSLPGFQTPAQMFGNKFVHDVPGTKMEIVVG